MKEEQHFLEVIISLLNTDIWDQSFKTTEAEPAKLRLKLKKAGIDSSQIAAAVAWFTHLHNAIHSFSQAPDAPHWQQHTVRIYDPSEQELLSTSGMRYIAHLEALHILDTYSKEIVLDMLSTLEAYQIDTPLIKWVALIVLYALPNHQNELLALELLVLDTPDTRVH